MSRFTAYIRNAAVLLTKYNGKVPLAAWLKQQFAGEKKYGSTDRRIIAGLCHQYFRIAPWAGDLPAEERLLAGALLCNNTATPLIQNLRPQWEPYMPLSTAEKLRLLSLSTVPEMPWSACVQAGTSFPAFAFSLCVQPDLFVRIRPGFIKSLPQKLENAGLHFSLSQHDIMRLPNGTPVEAWAAINRELVIQDAGSQLCGKIIYETLPQLKGDVWDCCAASGGKSIHLYDLYGKQIRLTVSDIRASILHNLKERFREAGVACMHAFTADLTQNLQGKVPLPQYDAIVADVPCTGSGTWARTPEQAAFFKPETIEQYTLRQQKIAAQVLPFVKMGGYLIYITCSIFDAENEAVTRQLMAANNGLKCVRTEIIDGISQQSDSMFIAILQRT